MAVKGPGYAASAIAVLVLLGWTGCTEPRDLIEDGGGAAERECFECHGDPANGNAAPPPALWATRAGVALHQVHLGQAGWHRTVNCQSCHLVPQEIFDEGHIDSDLPAEVIFGGLALADGARPRFDPGILVCSGVYCHGATLEGASIVSEPVWDASAPSDAPNCASCHGFPPMAGSHPAKPFDCALCHGEVVGAGDTIIAPDLHIDGNVSVVVPDCDGCHGSDDQPAPPVDTDGNSDTTAAGVGAHRAHLGESDWHAEVECTECHVVPDELDDPGHADTLPPAELVWGPLAENDGAAPEYDEGTLVCSGTYCHGATLEPGGSNVAPVWNEVGADQAECGTCHGLPPEGRHPNVSDCSRCHGEVIDETFSFVSPELHVNGTVNVIELRCNTCHGDSEGSADVPSDWAPPVDLAGDTETSEPGVGAHQSHLGASDWHVEILCDDCHDVPAELDDPGHLDGPPADLDFSPLAGSVSYDTESGECSDSYCHGAALDAGGSLTEPVWTAVGEDQAECGTCHGLPPARRHPQVDNCGACHGRVADNELNIVDPTLHINGRVDIN